MKNQETIKENSEKLLEKATVHYKSKMIIYENIVKKQEEEIKTLENKIKYLSKELSNVEDLFLGSNQDNFDLTLKIGVLKSKLSVEKKDFSQQTNEVDIHQALADNTLNDTSYMSCQEGSVLAGDTTAFLSEGN